MTAHNDTLAKPYPWWVYLYGFVTPGTTALSIYLGGGWTFLTVGWVFVAVPVIDWALGNRFFAARETHGDPRVHAALCWFTLPLQVAMLGWALWIVGTQPLSALEAVGITLSVGLAGGSFAITNGHELVHRRRAWERGIGVALLATVSNTPFRIEHVYGHHKNVATPIDPATARAGEGLYHFVPRSMVWSVISAWRIEARQMRKKGLAVWNPRNRMLHYAAIELALCVAITVALGWPALLFFLAQSVIAIFSLETVNYLEHYGLVRKPTAPDKYEPFGPQHAWNSAHVATDTGLFNLGRHSDHHLHAERPFPELGNDPTTPQLPGGYATSYLLAMIPPLWRRIMDPKVEAWRARYS